MNSKLSVRKIEKHEIQILDCDGKLKDNENWMSAETSRVRGVAIRQMRNSYDSKPAVTACSFLRTSTSDLQPFCGQYEYEI